MVLKGPFWFRCGFCGFVNDCCFEAGFGFVGPDFGGTVSFVFLIGVLVVLVVFVVLWSIAVLPCLVPGLQNSAWHCLLSFLLFFLVGRNFGRIFFHRVLVSRFSLSDGGPTCKLRT